MNFSIGKLAIGFLVAALVAAGLVLVGPHRIALATEATGSTDLAQKLRDNAQRGHHNLTAFTLSNGKVSFAGLGADEHTEVEIGSVTKMFTAELLRQEVESQHLTYETKVGEVLDTGDSPISDVTLTELTEHTSGLPRLAQGTSFLSLTSAFSGKNPYANETKADILSAAKDAKLTGRGTESYSNLGYALLGLVLEESSGKSYEQLLRANILEPAGMEETYLMSLGAVPDNASRGLTNRGRSAEPWEMPGTGPAGAIRSTAHDMTKFAEWMLAYGDFTHGWQENPVEDGGGFCHNGGTYGYSSTLIIDPRTRHAAFVNNDSPAGTENITRTIFKELP